MRTRRITHSVFLIETLTKLAFHTFWFELERANIFEPTIPASLSIAWIAYYCREVSFVCHLFAGVPEYQSRWRIWGMGLSAFDWDGDMNENHSLIERPITLLAIHEPNKSLAISVTLTIACMFVIEFYRRRRNEVYRHHRCRVFSSVCCCCSF